MQQYFVFLVYAKPRKLLLKLFYEEEVPMSSRMKEAYKKARNFQSSPAKPNLP